MIWLLFLELLTFIVAISAAAYLLFRNPRNKINQAFALSAFAIAGWNLSIFLVLSGVGPADFLGRLAFPFTTLFFVSFFWFLLEYPTPIKYKRVLGWALLVSSLPIFVLTNLPGFVTGVTVIDGYITGDFHEVFRTIFTLHVYVLILALFVLFAIRIRSAEGLVRAHLKQVLFGFGAFILLTAVTNSILPAIFNVSKYNNLGPVFTLLPLLFVLSAILRYRLLDIKWVVGKSLVFSLITAIALWVLTLFLLLVSNLLSEQFALLFAALLIALTFKPITNFLDNLIRRIFAGGSYDPIDAQEEVLELVRTQGNLNKLNAGLLDKLTGYFSADEIAIAVFNTKRTKILGFNSRGFGPEIRKDVTACSDLLGEKAEILERGEIEWRLRFSQKDADRATEEHQLKVLQKSGVEAVIPLAIDDHLVGVILFGKRRYDRAFKTRDVQFLNNIGAVIAPALENAAKFEEMKNLYEELAQLDQAKSDFITVVSHRFRTPLASIRWAVENIVEEGGKALDPNVKNGLFDVHNHTLFLIDTLNRLFDSLDIESGKLKLAREEFKAKEAFSLLEHEIKKHCKEAGLTCKFNIGNVVMSADKRRITEVARVLLENAVHYSHPDGSVTFSITTGKNKKDVVIKVEDKGIGIPKDAEKKIFDKFYRGKNAALSYTDGQGLGLYYAKGIVELHKGQIEIESELGHGTTFTVTLPVGVTTKKKRKGPAKRTTKKKVVKMEVKEGTSA